MTLCPAPVAPPTDDHPLIGNLTDCTYFALFDTSSASIANLVPGGDPATETGSPTYAADQFITNSNAVSGLGGLQLPASSIPQEGEDQMYILIATRETSGAYIANNGTNADGQVVDENGVFGLSAGPRMKNSQLNDLGQAVGVWPSSGTDFYFIAGYAQARGHPYVVTGIGGVLSPIYAGNGQSDRPLRANAAPLFLNPDAEGNAEIRYATVAAFKRLPAAGELQTIYTAMRNYYNGRGNITVV